MVEEKQGELKHLFVYEHDASRLELFIRIVYSFVVALVLDSVRIYSRNMHANPVACDIDTRTQKREVKQLY